MSAIWPMRRPEPQWVASASAPVVVGAPVSTVTWQALGGLANWLRAKGACLVPECCPERSITSGVTETFRFYVKPRNTAIARVWTVGLRAASAATAVTAQVRAPSSGTFADAVVAHSGSARQTLVYVETLGAKSGTAAQIEIDIKSVGGTTVVESISCYEQDRPLLAQDATDYGVDTTTLRSGQPIYDGAYESLGGIVDSLANSDARRVGIWHWTAGDGTAAAITSASPANLLTLGCPVLGRKLARAATTGSVKWSVYAKMSSAGTGTVTLSTSQSGVSDAMSVTSTSYAWTTPRTVAISCDDMTAIDGLQSSAFDDAAITIAGSGAQTLTVKSISIWSDD